MGLFIDLSFESKKGEKEKKELTGKSGLLPMRFDSAAVDHHCHFLFKFKACGTQLTRFVFDNTNNLYPRSFSEIPTPWFDQ